MAVPHPDKEFILERQSRYQAACNSADINAVLAFMSEGIEFSDFSIGLIALGKPAVHDLFTEMYASCGNFDIKTVSVSGDKYFTAWEWNVSFNYLKPASMVTHEASLGTEMADGRLMKMIGVSLTWWNEEGMIIKNHEYGKVVESFEGR